MPIEPTGNAYLDTLARLEPDIAVIDYGAGLASMAISLKRIADSLEKIASAEPNAYGEEGVNAITGPLDRCFRNFTDNLSMTLQSSRR